MQTGGFLARGIQLLDGSKAVFEESSALDPATTYIKVVKGLPAKAVYTFQISDPSGSVLFRHEEGTFDAAQSSER